jgi:hypothetical protein
MRFSANDGRAKHVELMTEVYSQKDFIPVGIDMNPGLEQFTPWAASYALKYEHYKAVSLVFRYIPRTSAAKEGTIYMYTDLNPNHGSAPEPAFFMQQDGAKSGPLYGYAGEPLTLRVDIRKAHQMHPWKQVRYQTTAESLIERDIGTFWYACVGTDGENPGYIEVDYDFMFSIPQAPPGFTSAQATLQIEAVPGEVLDSNSTTIPLSVVVNNSASFTPNATDTTWQAPDDDPYFLQGNIVLDTSLLDTRTEFRVTDASTGETLFSHFIPTGFNTYGFAIFAPLIVAAGVTILPRFFTGVTTLGTTEILTVKKCLMVATKLAITANKYFAPQTGFSVHSPKDTWIRHMRGRTKRSEAELVEVWARHNKVKEKKHHPQILPPKIESKMESSHSAGCSDEKLLIGDRHVCLTKAELSRLAQKSQKGSA